MSGNAEFTAAFFDEASVAWRANKKHVGDGMFKYVRTCRVVMPKPKPKPVVVPVVVPVVKKLPPILDSLPLLRRSPRFSRA